MRFKLLIAFLAAAAFLTACHKHHHPPVNRSLTTYPPATIDVQAHIGEIHNLTYAKKGRSIEQTMDLYVPLEGKPPYPVVLWLHGGSWMYGDKAADCLACQVLSKHYAIASTNYRLDQEAAFPAMIYDLKAAVRYLQAHAKEYKLDPDRIGVWGQSAGGHLAALLGTSGGVKALEGNEGYAKYSSKVQAVCDWCGPTDFNTAQSQAPSYCKIKFYGETSPVYVLMGADMSSDSLAKASPVTYVSKDDPPFLIMHGDIDDAIPTGQSQELYDRLKSVGVDATLHIVKGMGHGLSSPENFKIVEDFFDSKLRTAKGK